MVSLKYIYAATVLTYISNPVNRELIIDSNASEVNIALLEDKSLVELHKEQNNNQFAVGDIFLVK